MGDSFGMTLAKLKVEQLRAELKSRGLNSSGTKSVLIARLQAALEHPGNETLQPRESSSSAVPVRSELQSRPGTSPASASATPTVAPVPTTWSARPKSVVAPSINAKSRPTKKRRPPIPSAELEESQSPSSMANGAYSSRNGTVSEPAVEGTQHEISLKAATSNGSYRDTVVEGGQRQSNLSSSSRNVLPALNEQPVTAQAHATAQFESRTDCATLYEKPKQVESMTVEQRMAARMARFGGTPEGRMAMRANRFGISEQSDVDESENATADQVSSTGDKTRMKGRNNSRFRRGASKRSSKSRSEVDQVESSAGQMDDTASRTANGTAGRKHVQNLQPSDNIPLDEVERRRKRARRFA